VACSWTMEVGVDVEAIGPLTDVEGFAARFLSASEQRALATRPVEWNATRTEMRAAPVHELMHECALRQPRAAAVFDGDRRLDYGEFDHRVQEVTDRLTGGGALSGEAQAVGGDPSVELVVQALGSLKAGAVLRWSAGPRLPTRWRCERRTRYEACSTRPADGRWR
jgi:non-ribosomal peptide synthetase component F